MLGILPILHVHFHGLHKQLQSWPSLKRVAYHVQPVSIFLKHKIRHNFLQAHSQYVNINKCMVLIINKCMMSILIILYLLLLHFLPGCGIELSLGTEVYNIQLDTRGRHRTLMSFFLWYWCWAVQCLKPSEASTQKSTWPNKKFPTENRTSKQILVCQELLIPEPQIRFFFF